MMSHITPVNKTYSPSLPLSGASNKTISLPLKSFSCLPFSLKYHFFCFTETQLFSWPVPLGNVSIILYMQLWLKSLDAVTSFVAACLSFWGGILEHNFFFPLTFGLKHLCHWNVSSEPIGIYRGNIKRKVLLGERLITVKKQFLFIIEYKVNMKDAWNLSLISGVVYSVV